MALGERLPRPSYHEPNQEHEITLYAGEDQHPVTMTCYDQKRFYIGGLPAQLESIKEESIVFAVTLESAHQTWTTLRYNITGEQFYHLLHGNEPVGFSYTGMLEATTRLAPPSPEQHMPEHEQ